MTSTRMTVEHYMLLPWVARFERKPDGEWKATVDNVQDFAFYGASEDEVRGEWREAFHAHLSAYMHFGKTIPLPDFGPPVVIEDVVQVGWDLESVAAQKRPTQEAGKRQRGRVNLPPLFFTSRVSTRKTEESSN